MHPPVIVDNRMASASHALGISAPGAHRSFDNDEDSSSGAIGVNSFPAVAFNRLNDLPAQIEFKGRYLAEHRQPPPGISS